MSTLAASPAPTQANTLFSRPGVGIWTGAVQVLPSSAEEENMSAVFPVTCPWVPGACSHTAKRLPARSIDIVGKFPPVTELGKLATGRSTHDRPVGSTVKATVWHRPIRMALNAALSWMTKMWCVVGLTSSLPMMPSLQDMGSDTNLEGANCTPAAAPPPGRGERAITRTLLTVEPGQTGGPPPTTS